MPYVEAEQYQAIPVAQYLRMSTEHQRYSIENQRESIEGFARTHNMRVVATFEDSGKSGLTLAGRSGLQSLLRAVLDADRLFSTVVVYDVSRWGRFQDIDEGAFYEYMCRRAGVDVVYCAEQFGNLPGPMGLVVKSLKRAMAAEFSRELGHKVFIGQRNLAKRGFCQGGYTPFGLQRILVSEEGAGSRNLQPGDRKRLQTDRVIYAPGDPCDALLVRAIFDLCARQGMHEKEIVPRLNWNCWPRPREPLLPWDRQAVRRILRAECYVGTMIWNRRSCRLRTKWAHNPKQDWVRTEHCFQGLVSQQTFDDAQHVLKEGHRHRWSNSEILDVLRRVQAKHGSVTPWRAFQETADSTLFARHFGSLAGACLAAGLEPSPKLLKLQDQSKQRQDFKIALLRAVAECFREQGKTVIWTRSSRLALIDETLLISVRVARCTWGLRSTSYWMIKTDSRLRPNTSVIARLAPGSNQVVLDYFILPLTETRSFYVARDGHVTKEWAEQYRFKTWDAVSELLTSLLEESVAPETLPRSLAKRRRRILNIQRRDDPYIRAVSSG